MKLSKAYWQTYKETPADAEVPSHKLLMRAGFINKTTGGIYSYLPMATRVLRKIQNIIREELDAIDGQEVLMSFVTPASLWQSSGRWDTMGPEMVRFKDRKDADFCLSATNEETVTDIFQNTVSSYKQLPVHLYQINTKFRDEIRPRFGILRGREFIMKDGYTFHVDKDCMDEMYEKYYQAYSKIFTRMGLDFIAVEADGGAMADSGSKTHEFQVIANTGEDDIIAVKKLGYAANIESAETYRVGLDFQAQTDLEEVLTENLPTCEAVAELLNIPVYQTLKTLVYTAEFHKKDGSIKYAHYILLLLGDDSLNEVKLTNFIKGANKLYPSTEETLKELGLPKGYMSPLGKTGVNVLIDNAIDENSSYVVGANKENYHTKGFTTSRDLEAFKKADLRLAKLGDVGPDKKTPIEFKKGIEVGQVFQLGQKYTKSMKVTVLDQSGKKVNPHMGCYGIGVSRTLAAAIEQHHDENGIIWPASIAPFDIYFAVIGKKEETKNLSNKIYNQLKSERLEILLDDRGLGPGGMFKDADLLGLPVRVTLGERDYDQTGELEIKIRKTGEVLKVKREELASKLKEVLTSLGKEF